MSAELPFDRDVDREALEQHRERARRAERRLDIKGELRRGAGVISPGRRQNGSPRATERIPIDVTPAELERLQGLADELHITLPALLRGCALAYERRLEGRL